MRESNRRRFLSGVGAVGTGILGANALATSATANVGTDDYIGGGGNADWDSKWNFNVQSDDSYLHQTTEFAYLGKDDNGDQWEYEFQLHTCGGNTNIDGEKSYGINAHRSDFYCPTTNLEWYRGVDADTYGMWPASGYTPNYEAVFKELFSVAAGEVRKKAGWFVSAANIVDALVPDEKFLGSSRKEGQSGEGFSIQKTYDILDRRAEVGHCQRFQVKKPKNTTETIEVESKVQVMNSTYNDTKVAFDLVLDTDYPKVRNVRFPLGSRD